MSACAIAISADGNQVVLAGDGMTTKDGEVHSLDSPKILKVNDRIAMLWMGCGKAVAGDLVALRAKQADTVKEVAEIVSDELKDAYDTPKTRHILEKIPFWVFIIGYDPGLNMYRVWSQSDNRYTPEKQEMPPGTLGAKTATRGPDQTSFQRLVATKYWPLYRPNLEHAVKEGFSEMVTSYQEEGEPCGGKLYFETLTQT